MDLTDNGVVFTTVDGKIWFTDGTSIHQIGQGEGYYGHRADANVVTSTSGSRAAWIVQSDQRAEIVVYDTAADREVARVPCGRLLDCALRSLVGEDHVYFTVDMGTTSPTS